MDCYACDQEATQRCPRCGNAYCAEHGDTLCAECLDPVAAAPSSTVFRTALFGLLVASVIALWLIVQPPSLPGESTDAIRPLPTVAPTDAAGTSTPTPAASPDTGTPVPSAEPTPAPTSDGSIEYTVVEGDTWFGIADAFGVDAENLAAVNGLTLEDFLRPGDVLVIPQ